MRCSAWSSNSLCMAPAGTLGMQDVCCSRSASLQLHDMALQSNSMSCTQQARGAAGRLRMQLHIIYTTSTWNSRETAYASHQRSKLCQLRLCLYELLHREKCALLEMIPRDGMKSERYGKLHAESLVCQHQVPSCYAQYRAITGDVPACHAPPALPSGHPSAS